MSKAAANIKDILNNKLISLLKAKPSEQSSEAIKKCLEEGADANFKDWYNSSALSLAIYNKHGHLTISHLLKYGADPNASDAHYSILYHAIYYDYCLPIIELLIENKANVNLGSITDEAESPLTCAIKRKNYKVASCLIEHGAIISDANHNNLIFNVIEPGEVEKTELLLDRRLISILEAVPNDQSSAAVEKCLKDGGNANVEDYNWSPALIVAINNGHDYNTISHLLKYGANPNALDFIHTVLWCAISRDYDLPSIKLLLENKANVNLGDIKNEAESPLTCAIKRKNYEVASCLIEHDAIISDANFNNLIFNFIETGEIEKTKLLFEKHIIINEKNIDGIRHKLLCYALKLKKFEIAKYFIEKGANIDGLGQDKPIYDAIANNDLEIIKFLVENKADLANTLSKCIIHNLKDIAEYLVDNGAMWDTKVYNGFHYIPEEIGSFTILRSLNASYSDSLKKVNYYETQKRNKELIPKIISENSIKDASKFLNLLKIKYVYKNDKFILSTQCVGREHYRDEENMKQESQTFIRDGKIYHAYTDKLMNCTHGLYVLDKKGALFVTQDNINVHHSFILRGVEGKTMLGNDISLYGYGKPVACAGHMTIKEGVLKEINNDSGHYFPNSDQLKLVCKHLFKLGVIANDTAIELYDDSSNELSAIELNLETLNIGEILDHYPSL